MSRKRHHHEIGLFDGCKIGGRKPTFPMIIILILIILQFTDGKNAGFNVADNGILFIIALFYLSCCISGKKGCC